MDRRTLIMGGTAVVALGAIGGFWATRQRQDTGMTQIMAATTEPAAEVDTSGITDMALGSPDAPVTLTEYASFTCPHCANFHKTVYPQLKADYIDTGKVKFVYRDVYFDRAGLWAAMLARCDPNRFFGIASMLYEQQKDWLSAESPAAVADNLRKIGKVAGLEPSQIDACLADDAKAEQLVAWFEKNMKADDVSGTPTLFIDGVKHSNMNYTDLKALLDEALDG